jgi:hypothetical protein
MKKPISFSAVATFITLITLLTYSCSHCTESKCTNSSRSIPPDSIETYAGYYTKMVSANPANTVQQVFLTDKELSCLAKLPTHELKFIFAAYDSNNINTKFIVVEVDSKDSLYYCDLDDMYPGICPDRLDASIKSSSHLCPPPTPCAIPLKSLKGK